jgi:excinuclease ABC subunit C
MLTEVLARRLTHTKWTLPNLILVDGGKAQVNAAQVTLKKYNFAIPLVGIAKGPNRNKTDFHFANFKKDEIKKNSDKYADTLIRLRDEAHRFALSYHKHLRKHDRD